MMTLRNLLPLFLLAALLGFGPTGRETVNSIGVRLVRVEPGSFTMGEASPRADGWDESPAHKVTISSPFLISETEITAEQFAEFQPGFTGSLTEGSAATGISWHEANAFCEWLTRKEGKPYRLPTEAEWEYAARAGAKGSLWSGDAPPAPDAPNPWGLKAIHSGPAEWCYDWYGPYADWDQVDPVGPVSGLSKVVRGGGLDRDSPYYARAANRASYAPAFGMMRGTDRVTARETSMPSTEPTLQGLIGLWFGRTNLTDPKAVDEITTLDLDWRFFQQPGQDRGEMWSGRWLGFIQAPTSGPITFHAASDRAVTLLVGGQKVIAWEGGEAQKSGTIELVEGKRYSVEIVYTHDHGAKTYLTLQWSWEGQSTTAIPREALSYSPAQRQQAVDEAPRQYLPGHHSIGLRVVQGPLPATPALPEILPFIQRCVVAGNNPHLQKGPDPSKPWLRRRPLLTIPSVGSSREETIGVGMHPGLLGHNHNPGFEIMPNGDLLAILFTSPYGPGGEDQPEVAMIASRLRFGADEWDMQEMFLDFADVNDTSSLLWREGDTVYLFWGHTFYNRAYPFQWTASTDSGASWGPVRFPQFRREIGPRTNQPVSTALRDRRGIFYLPSDAIGGTSVLWATDNNFDTWFDTGGRTFGRHTNIALTRDGRILGMGGKNSDIDGFMPKSISDDGGKTWKVSKTPFPELGSGQRPSLLRLASGRLFFAGDLQHSSGQHPEAYKERGAYVAVSEDDGETWRIKQLPGALPADPKGFNRNPNPTLGYTVARQAANGLIHMISTKTLPPQHWELNEAWILSQDAGLADAPVSQIVDVKEQRHLFPSGRVRRLWSAGRLATGEYRLQGRVTSFYENGVEEWTVEYDRGVKRGMEVYRTPSDQKLWERDHKDDGSETWRQFWPDGSVKSESNWRGGRADGTARIWDRKGHLLRQVVFKNGSARGE